MKIADEEVRLKTDRLKVTKLIDNLYTDINGAVTPKQEPDHTRQWYENGVLIHQRTIRE